MKMKKFELVLAAVFFLVGFFLLIFSQTGTTGGFIGGFDIIEATTMFIGLLALFSGLVIYVGGRGLEGIMTKQNIRPLNQVAKEIVDIEPEKSKRVLVLDTGFFINYKKNAIRLDEFLKGYDRIYTTQEADEVLGSHIRKVLKDHGCKILRMDALKESAEVAEKYLSQTGKAGLAAKFLPYFREKNPEPLPATNAGQAKFMKDMREAGLIPRMNAKDRGAWNPDTAYKNPDLFKSAVRQYLEKCCVVSDGDKDVVATAERLARRPGDSVFVAANDSHIRDAVDLIKSKEGLNVHYVEVGHT